MIDTQQILKQWSPDKIDSSRLSSLISNRKHFLLESATTFAKGLVTKGPFLPTSNSTWEVSCSADKTQIAVLQESILEAVNLVMNGRDYRVDIVADKRPQLRAIAWSLDGKCIIW